MCFRRSIIILYCLSSALSPTQPRRNMGSFRRASQDASQDDNLAKTVVRIISDVAMRNQMKNNNYEDRRSDAVQNREPLSSEPQDYRDRIEEVPEAEEVPTSAEGAFQQHGAPASAEDTYQQHGAPASAEDRYQQRGDDIPSRENQRDVYNRMQQYPNQQQPAEEFINPEKEPNVREKKKLRTSIHDIDIDELAEKVKKKLEKYFTTKTDMDTDKFRRPVKEIDENIGRNYETKIESDDNRHKKENQKTPVTRLKNQKKDDRYEETAETFNQPTNNNKNHQHEYAETAETFNQPTNNNKNHQHEETPETFNQPMSNNKNHNNNEHKHKVNSNRQRQQYQRNKNKNVDINNEKLGKLIRNQLVHENISSRYVKSLTRKQQQRLEVTNNYRDKHNQEDQKEKNLSIKESVGEMYDTTPFRRKKIHNSYEDYKTSPKYETPKQATEETIDTVRQKRKKVHDSYEDYKIPQKDEKPKDSKSGIYDTVHLKKKKGHDSYEDYKIPPRDENFFESEEPKDPSQKNNGRSNKDMEYFNEKLKTTKQFVETANLNFDSKEEEVLELKGTTSLPTRVTYSQYTPTYYQALPVVAQQYNFDEPLPERDRIDNETKYNIPPAKINGRLTL